MAKYIIDIPDDGKCQYRYNKDTKELKFSGPRLDPNSFMGLDITISISGATPYTESDRKAIEDEVWELAKKIGSFKGLTRDELNECFGYITIQDVMTKYDTYQEAKSKYDAWEQEKEEIHVGDEVKIANTIGVVTRVPEYDEQRVHYIAESGTVYCNNAYADIVKTGRHFDEVENLLKKMEED